METEETAKTQKRGMSRHALIMLLCCLVPLGILAAVWIAGFKSSYLTYGVLLLCPLMHVAMMLGSRKKDGDTTGHSH